MKVDPRCVSAKWHDRQVLSPSFSCPLKISLSLHLWTFKVILRCASAALADPRTALPSSLLSVCLPCQAERKTSLCVAEALCSPSFPIVCTPTATSIHRHAWTHTHTHTPTHTLCTLADRDKPGEPVKIWVAQQEQGVWIYSDWCPVLTFSDNGWEIMEKADIQEWNIGEATWCLSWPWAKTTALMLHFWGLDGGWDLSHRHTLLLWTQNPISLLSSFSRFTQMK